MRFTVIGTDAQTGRDIEEGFEAKSADHAEYLASQRGISVQRVKVTATETLPANKPATAAPAHAPWVAVVADHRPNPSAQADRAESPSPRPSVAGSTRHASPTVEPVADAPRKLGLIALGLGGVGLLFCWIPVIGMISIPLCLIGAAAGGLGAWTLRARSRLVPLAARSLALPLGGAALSVLALAIAGVVALGPAETATGAVRAAPTVLPDAKMSEAKPARSLAIVGSHTSGEAASLFTPRPAATPPVTPAEAPKPVKIGDAEVELVSASVENLLLIGEAGRSHGESTDKMLVIKLRVRNAGDSAISYLSFAGDEANLDGRAASLADERGVRFRRTTFEIGVAPIGRVRQDRLPAGRDLTDTLVFHVPPTSITNASITLHGECVGAAGTVELTFPASMIRR
ncbi:MAG: hypothetical protein IT438_12765 [Phycisphaerales bacterium]|nr:hypothetical protein [Phycisphaerales bacterium]